MKRTVIAVTVFAAVLSLFMCRTRPPGLKEPSYSSITVSELKSRLEAGDGLLLLDVRTPEEFSGPLGHLEGATLIPVQELEARIDELKDSQDKEIIVYCRSGNRSRTAAEILARHKFKVTNMLGGMKAWNATEMESSEE